MKKTKLAMMWEIDESSMGCKFMASITKGWTFSQACLSVVSFCSSSSLEARVRVTTSTMPLLKSVARSREEEGRVEWKDEMIAEVPLPGPQPMSRIVIAEEKGECVLRRSVRRAIGMDMGALEIF
jgi:hypothetical protein